VKPARGEGATAVRLRPARRRDLEAIGGIEVQAFGDPWSQGSFGALLDNPLVWFVVAEEEGSARLAGYIVAWFVADEAEVANLAVAPALRRRGIGAVLLDDALAEAERRGARAVYLEVRQSNAAARALYRSRGFDEIGRRPRYYRAPVEDALVLRRTSPG
jgi:ribosomal-protein-alanine N-acetyltransferase